MSDNKQPPKIEVFKNEEGLLLDHNYDGIHEFDHVLPRWWLGILYATIVFAAWYAGYYLSGQGPTPQQELQVAMKEIEAMRPATAAPSAAEDQALLAAFKDPEKLKVGAQVFTAKCVPCHGDKAQGVVGPNLTDDFWIHGTGTLRDIAAVVTNGVLDKGMPAWGPLLSQDELRDVVAFVHSVHGTNPAGAKAPQGDKQEFKD